MLELREIKQNNPFFKIAALRRIYIETQSESQKKRGMPKHSPPYCVLLLCYTLSAIYYYCLATA